MGERIAVIVPCYNEEVAVGAVVSAFARYLPEATIYVYDNNSSDDTARVARAAGAVVRSEKRQGKGFAVRRAFADIDADLYVLVDGDDTYEAAAAPRMLETLRSGPFDYVNGARQHESKDAYRPGHTFGNKALSEAVALLFGRQSRDILSGYKILSRRFVKSFPMLSRGFEIETELMIHALELGMPIAEVETRYKERPTGSFSKLSTFKDGFRILSTILRLVESERPLFFFGVISALLWALSFGLAIPLLVTYVETGLVPRLPTAVLSGLIGVVATFSLFCGLILDLTQRARHEVKRLAYLAIPAPRTEAAEARRAVPDLVN